MQPAPCEPGLWIGRIAGRALPFDQALLFRQEALQFGCALLFRADFRLGHGWDGSVCVEVAIVRWIGHRRRGRYPCSNQGQRQPLDVEAHCHDLLRPSQHRRPMRVFKRDGGLAIFVQVSVSRVPHRPGGCDAARHQLIRRVEEAHDHRLAVFGAFHGCHLELLSCVGQRQEAGRVGQRAGVRAGLGHQQIAVEAVGPLRKPAGLPVAGVREERIIERHAAQALRVGHGDHWAGIADAGLQVGPGDPACAAEERQRDGVALLQHLIFGQAAVQHRQPTLAVTHIHERALREDGDRLRLARADDDPLDIGRDGRVVVVRGTDRPGDDVELCLGARHVADDAGGEEHPQPVVADGVEHLGVAAQQGRTRLQRQPRHDGQVAHRRAASLPVGHQHLGRLQHHPDLRNRSHRAGFEEAYLRRSALACDDPIVRCGREVVGVARVRTVLKNGQVLVDGAVDLIRHRQRAICCDGHFEKGVFQRAAGRIADNGRRRLGFFGTGAGRRPRVQRGVAQCRHIGDQQAQPAAGSGLAGDGPTGDVLDHEVGRQIWQRNDPATRSQGGVDNHPAARSIAAPGCVYVGGQISQGARRQVTRDGRGGAVAILHVGMYVVNADARDAVVRVAFQQQPPGCGELILIVRAAQAP